EAAVLEAARLTRHSHGFVLGEAGIGRVLEGVFFRAVDGHAVLAAHAAIDELDNDFLADTLNVAVTPLLEREGGGFAAAFVGGALIGAAGGVGVDLVGWAKDNVDVAAVALPAGAARCV